MIQKIFKMLKQYAVDIPTLSVNLCLSHHAVPGGMLSSSIGMPSRKDGPPSIWDTHGISGNVFLQIQMGHLQHFILKNYPSSSHISEPTHSSPAGKNDNQTPVIRDASPDRQPKIQSFLVREILQKIMGQTNNGCRFRISTLTNSLHQPRSLAGR